MRRLVVLLLVGCQAADPLSTTQQELVTVLPASHDFGSLQIGQSSPVFTISVNPAIGANDDIVTAITASCPDFTINAPGLPAEVYRTCDTSGCAVVCPAICTTLDYQNYTFDTLFHPTVAGMVSCAVTITTNNTTNRTITLTGTGTVPPIDIDVQPSAVAFGDVRRNTDSSAATITVRNLGGSTMTVSSVAVSGSYAMAGPTSYQVAPGGSMAHQITCHPIGIGSTPGSFVVQSNDPATPTVSVPLTCNGIDSNLAITPSPAVLATTRVGEPVMQSIAIGNSGNLSTTLDSVSVTGTGITMVSGPPPGTMLGPNQTATVMVEFDATAKGDASGMLSVGYDNGMQRTAQISAKAQLASMSLSPDGEIDLGPVCSGQSKSQTFTLLGNGDASFSLNAIGSPTPPFAVTRPTLPASVKGSGGSTVMFDVSAAPIVAGPAQATIELDTDIPGTPTHTITVDVTGLDPGVGATPSDLDLGSNPIDVTTIGQMATLTNCNTDAVTFGNARIEGDDAAEFAIVSQPPNLTVGATESASWLVVLTAHSRGVKIATFAVDYPDGTATVNLTGEGLAPRVDRESYYACNATGSTAAWPLVVAFIVLRRRRR